jgi:hypothetical protein
MYNLVRRARFPGSHVLPVVELMESSIILGFIYWVYGWASVMWVWWVSERAFAGPVVRVKRA